MSRGHRQIVAKGRGHTGSHRVSTAALDAQGEHRVTVKFIHPEHPAKVKIKKHKARVQKIKKARKSKGGGMDPVEAATQAISMGRGK